MTVPPKASRPHMPGYELLPADQGKGLKPWSYAVERLTHARGYWISTTCPDGRPHSVPIWGLWLRDEFAFSTGAQSKKARNLRANPRVVIGAEPSDDSIVLEGEARIEEDPEWKRAFVEHYRAKYGWVLESEPTYAVRPSVAFYYSSDDFTAGATRWVFSADSRPSRLAACVPILKNQRTRAIGRSSAKPARRSGRIRLCSARSCT